MNNEKIEFKPNPKLKDRSDLFLNDERIGDVASNLVPVIKGCFDIYTTMKDYVETNYGKEELDKNYSAEEMAQLAKDDYEKAVNIILYQVGKQAFLGFKGILQETSPISKLKGATGILNNVKMLLSKLGPDSAPTHLTDKNRENAKMFADNFQIITDVLNETAETVVFLFRGFVVDQCDYAAGVTDAFNNAVGNKTVNILNYPPKTHSIRDLRGRKAELADAIKELEDLKADLTLPTPKNGMLGKSHADQLLQSIDKVYLSTEHKAAINAKHTEFLNLYPKAKREVRTDRPKKLAKKRTHNTEKNAGVTAIHEEIHKSLDLRIDELKRASDLNDINLKKVQRNPLRWIQYLFTSKKLTKRVFGKKFAKAAPVVTEASGNVEEVTEDANKRRAFSFKSPLLQRGKAAGQAESSSGVELRKK